MLLQPFAFQFGSCALCFPTITTKDYHYFGPCLRTQNELVKQSPSSACTDGGNSQGEDTLETIRIEESHHLLQNTFHKALNKGQSTGLKERFENMDLLTVMLATAIPTIPTKCRLVSITF